MTRIEESTIGTRLDDFLAQEDLLGGVTAVAHKRVLAFHIKNAMKEQHLTKSEMASRMNTSRAAVDRLLNPNNSGVTLDTLDRAAAALGLKLSITFSLDGES